jgi:hypothetical protein
MTFEVADIGRGDVLGVFETMEAAENAARRLCEEHPEESEDLAILEIGDDGHRVGAPHSVEELLHGNAAPGALA